MDILGLIVILAAYILVMRFLLPRFGVPT